jgi:hypothetical protein
MLGKEGRWNLAVLVAIASVKMMLGMVCHQGQRTLHTAGLVPPEVDTANHNLVGQGISWR